MRNGGGDFSSYSPPFLCAELEEIFSFLSFPLLPCGQKVLGSGYESADSGDPHCWFVLEGMWTANSRGTPRKDCSGICLPIYLKWAPAIFLFRNRFPLLPCSLLSLYSVSRFMNCWRRRGERG